jgi:ABC-type multidrug transport system ATPase subunit
MIRTRGLTKRYGGMLAVDGVSLDVPEGERYGFLGPNGSGKTTTVRMLLGLVFATSGEIELLGKRVPSDAAAALADVGSLVEGPAAYGHLSARANLDLFDAAGPSDSRLARLSRSRRRERIDEALELVGLGGVGRKPVRAYSLGMRQRLLVLDEPTNGLDPQGIQEIRELLLKLNSDGTTIFLSSHQMAEVEQLCTRVGVMDRGRLVSQVSMADVRRPTGRVRLRVGDPQAALALLDGHVAERDGDRLLVAGTAVPELVRRLVGRDIEVHEAIPERRTLESLVLELTGPGSDRVDSARRSPDGGAGSATAGGERS